jgi:hypothetical protein
MYIFLMDFECVADFFNAFGSICKSGCVESSEASINVFRYDSDVFLCFKMFDLVVLIY